MTSKIYNLIILDESGSMSGVKPQTISGCNETINTIRSAQEKFAETQEHFVSIYAFQDNDKVPSRYLIKNEAIDKVSHINAEQYEPWGCTPLYDAIGSTITDLKAITKNEKLAIGSITIITDGMENASKQYTREQVARMIDAVKEIGWSVNFIGANIDVKGTADSLHIDNAMEFQQDREGTRAMFEKERRSRMGWLGRTHIVMASMTEESCASPEGREQYYSSMRETSTNYFDEEDEKA